MDADHRVVVPGQRVDGVTRESRRPSHDQSYARATARRRRGRRRDRRSGPARPRSCRMMTATHRCLLNCTDVFVGTHKAVRPPWGRAEDSNPGPFDCFGRSATELARHVAPPDARLRVAGGGAHSAAHGHVRRTSTAPTALSPDPAPAPAHADLCVLRAGRCRRSCVISGVIGSGKGGRTASRRTSSRRARRPRSVQSGPGPVPMHARRHQLPT